jgi:hypothetical protein
VRSIVCTPVAAGSGAGVAAAGWVSAIASAVIVPKKPDVASPVASTRPAAAACRRRLLVTFRLVRLSTTGTSAALRIALTIGFADATTGFVAAPVTMGTEVVGRNAVCAAASVALATVIAIGCV